MDGWRDLLVRGDPDGKLWSPGMADTVLRNHHWFWYPDTEHTIKPLEVLVDHYYTSVGRNCNLMLGLTPNPDGLLPEADFRRCEEFGREIRRRFAAPLAETSGQGFVIELSFPTPSRMNHVTIMEDITQGERVRKYEAWGLVPGNTWQRIGDGSSIGHKRIQQFDPMEVAKVQLRITDSVGVPIIRQFAAYCVE
jgi:alpha-L-fucosidase